MSQQKTGYLLEYKRSDGAIVRSGSPVSLRVAMEIAQATANENLWPVHLIAAPGGESIGMVEPSLPWVCMGVKINGAKGAAT